MLRDGVINQRYHVCMQILQKIDLRGQKLYMSALMKIINQLPRLSLHICQVPEGVVCILQHLLLVHRLSIDYSLYNYYEKSNHGLHMVNSWIIHGTIIINYKSQYVLSTPSETQLQCSCVVLLQSKIMHVKVVLGCFFSFQNFFFIILQTI